MTDAQMKRRLEAIHAQAASLLVAVETLMADCGEAPAESQGCKHPIEKRRSITTLADKNPRYKCGECGQEGV